MSAVVSCDARVVGQAVINIVKNAIESIEARIADGSKGEEIKGTGVNGTGITLSGLQQEFARLLAWTCENRIGF